MALYILQIRHMRRDYRPACERIKMADSSHESDAIWHQPQLDEFGILMGSSGVDSTEYSRSANGILNTW
jgi:hypothetical protein